MFADTRARVDELAGLLAAQGIRAAALHGDMLPPQRQQVLASFRAGQTHVLVATDVASRGLDIKNLKTVSGMEVGKGGVCPCVPAVGNEGGCSCLPLPRLRRCLSCTGPCRQPCTCISRANSRRHGRHGPMPRPATRPPAHAGGELRCGQERRLLRPSHRADGASRRQGGRGVHPGPSLGDVHGRCELWEGGIMDRHSAVFLEACCTARPGGGVSVCLAVPAHAQSRQPPEHRRRPRARRRAGGLPGSCGAAGHGGAARRRGQRLALAAGRRCRWSGWQEARVPAAAGGACMLVSDGRGQAMGAPRVRGGDRIVGDSLWDRPSCKI